MLLADQDRSQWDRAEIAEGIALVREALRTRPPSRYALQAAIAAVHDEAASWQDTDWREVVALYGRAAAALALAGGRAEPGGGGGSRRRPGTRAWPSSTGWPASRSWPRYSYLPAARADFLRRLGRVDEARTAYEEALLLTENEPERRFLQRRLTELS